MQIPNPYMDEIFRCFAQNNPDPKTELNYTNLYTLLVAVALSAQATDLSVNKATKELFLKYDNPVAILEIGEEGLKNYIKSIGLYNSKAKNIIALSKILVEKYGGHVPDKFEELITLPGVGRKTANVVMNCWYNLPTMPVDTHVFRVAKRLALAKGNSPEQVERELLANISMQWLSNAHHWLVLHGRYICIARKPKCVICPVNKYCPTKEKFDN